MRKQGLEGDLKPMRRPISENRMTDVAESALSAAINNTQTNIPIVAWHPEWPTASAFLICIDQEFILITGGHGTTTLTGVRGATAPYGTTNAAASHLINAKVTTAFHGLNQIEHKAYSLGGVLTDQLRLIDSLLTGVAPWYPDDKWMKITVRPGDFNDSADTTRERCEVARTTQGELGEECWYLWRVRFPATWDADTNGATIMQCGPNHGVGSPALYMRANSTGTVRINFNSGVLNVSTNVGTYTATHNIFTTTPTDKNIEFLMRVVWDIATGIFQLWWRYEGDAAWTRAINLSGIPTSNSLSGATPSVKFKRGLYKSGADVNGLTSYIWHGSYRFGRSMYDVLLDDVSPTEESLGVFPDTTNLVAPQPSHETTDLTNFSASGTATRTREQSHPLFGDWNLRVDLAATNDTVYHLFSGLTVSQKYIASVWVVRDEVDFGIIKCQVRNNANSSTIAEVNLPRQRGPFRVEIPFTAVDTAGRFRFIDQDANIVPIRLFADGWQIENNEVPTPFTPTSRADSRLTIPRSLFNIEQGFVIAKIKWGFDHDAAPTGLTSLPIYRVGDGSFYNLGYYIISSKQVALQLNQDNSPGESDGMSRTVSTPLKPFKHMESIVTFVWDQTQSKIAVNDAAPVVVLGSRTPLIPWDLDLVDIGQTDGTGIDYLYSWIKWMIIGQGAITDAQIATLGNPTNMRTPAIEEMPSGLNVTGILNGAGGGIETKDYSQLATTVFSGG